MKFVTAAEMRKLDEATIDKHGVPGEVLMARAGRGIARELLQLLRMKGLSDASVLLVAGKGNNGGDAFVVARLLQEAGCRCQVWLAGAEDGVKGDARIHLDLMKAAQVPFVALATEEEWTVDRNHLPLVDLVVDALLGTGSEGAPRGVIGKAVSVINTLGRDALVAAVDLPTGLNGDTGKAASPCVVADYTYSLGLPKKGFLHEDAWDFTGSIESIDIGIPASLMDGIGEDVGLELIASDFVRAVFPRRPRLTNKGTYGRTLLIGGAHGYSGAISLAARGALASGAGLVNVYTPASMASTVAAQCPEAMVSPARETETGSLAGPLEESVADISRYQAILVGPGMTRHPDTLRILRDLLRIAEAPVIIDADGLNVVEGRGHWLDNSSSTTIITPHPGEMARLLGVDMMTVLSDRRVVTRNAAEITGGIAALKGAGTIVSDGKERHMINLTGNPGMATGGTGDVLAGMTAGFVAQGLDPFDALAVAIYLHGKTGDFVAAHKGQHGLKASDLAERLPEVMRYLL